MTRAVEVAGRERCFREACGRVRGVEFSIRFGAKMEELERVLWFVWFIVRGCGVGLLSLGWRVCEIESVWRVCVMEKGSFGGLSPG